MTQRHGRGWLAHPGSRLCVCHDGSVRIPGRSSDGMSACLAHRALHLHTATPARSLVHDIIGKHSDLMAMFNEFLMRCEVGQRAEAPQGAEGLRVVV